MQPTLLPSSVYITSKVGTSAVRPLLKAVAYALISFNRPMVDCTVDPADGFLARWCRPSFPCRPSVHEWVIHIPNTPLSYRFTVWPANLVSCALFNTLHSQYFSGQGTRSGISRERFFLYVFLGSFTWYFVPGYLFQALSYFAWVTFIFPKSATVGALFGYRRGMGMSVITFDWAQIAYIGSPLATPW